MRGCRRAGTPCHDSMTKRDANVYLADEQIEAIDELVDDGVYDSRSAAVREAVDEELFDGGVET